MVGWLGMCARAARGTPPLLPFFVVNAATFGRVNAYARWSLVQLKLSSWLLACAFFGLLMSYSTLASVFVHPLFAERIGAKEIEN